jgi:SSS family solute:Na+ symporter
MLAGLVIVPIVSFLTPAPDKAAVDFAFAGYDRRVTVQAREALGDEKQ